MKYGALIKTLFILISILIIVFILRLFSIITKNMDKSELITGLLIKNNVFFFSPSSEYVYWGNDEGFIKSIVNIFLPGNKYVYEQAAFDASTMPSEYIAYYTAMSLSDNAGYAIEATKDNNKTMLTINSENTVLINNYSLSQLNSYPYLVNEFYTVDRTTYIDEDLLNATSFLSEDFRINKSDTIILIYHTHSQEAFADSKEGDPDTSIVKVGEYLAELLSKKYGFTVIHNTSVYDFRNGKLDRSKAYSYAEADLEAILAEHPEIDVIIDLHRDGLDGDKMTTNINGKETARIMFFNGLSRTVESGDIEYLYNPYRAQNLAFSFQAQLIANQKYPGLMRPIYLKGYQYNLHFRPRSMLVEAGSQKNTLEEMMNAMEPLADILNTILSEQISVN